MSEQTCRVLVAGGGPAGLAASVLLAQNGVDVVCLAPAAAADPRTTALMMPSIRLLQTSGVWDGDVASASEPLRHLHIIDDTGNMISAPPLRFSSAELGLECFGWNVPLAVLLPALRQRAERHGVRMMEMKAIGAVCRESGIEVAAENGQHFFARLAIAADGAQSALRKAAGIAATDWSIEQMALVTSFSHSAPHQGISTEWHKKGGPFTTVPLPGNFSSLVWMTTPAVNAQLMALSPAALASEIQLQCHGALGLISDVAPCRTFPMRGVKAETFAANRTLLTGEAAHVFPPVGAQGLNMSLRDVGHAVDLILGADDPGSDAIIDAYCDARRGDVWPRQLAVSAVNTSLLSDTLVYDIARVAGLAAVGNIPALREYVLREGLAPSGNLPTSMLG